MFTFSQWCLLAMVDSVFQVNLHRRKLLLLYILAFRKCTNTQYDSMRCRSLPTIEFQCFMRNLNWLSFVQLTESNGFFFSSAENPFYSHFVWHCTLAWTHLTICSNLITLHLILFTSFKWKRNGENECLLCNGQTMIHEIMTKFNKVLESMPRY